MTTLNINFSEYITAETGRLVYAHHDNPYNSIKLKSSIQAAKFARTNWRDINFIESFAVIACNRSNAILGFAVLTIGGRHGTVVDIVSVLQYLIALNASTFFMVHNHPSGNLSPSQADNQITKKCKEAAALHEITLLDHVIITSDSHFSYADESLLF